MTKFQNKYRIESTRLPEWDYSNPGLYFVTICTKNMIEWFGRVSDGKMKLNSLGEVVAKEWRYTPKIRNYVELFEWVIMPNHFHGIIGVNETVEPTGSVVSNKKESTGSVGTNSNETIQRIVSTTLKPDSLGSIIGQFKSVCTKRIRKTINPRFGWQPLFWDHIIRNEKSFDRIQKYILLNPQNWTRDKNNRNMDMDFAKKL